MALGRFGRSRKSPTRRPSSHPISRRPVTGENLIVDGGRWLKYVIRKNRRGYNRNWKNNSRFPVANADSATYWQSAKEGKAGAPALLAEILRREVRLYAIPVSLLLVGPNSSGSMLQERKGPAAIIRRASSPAFADTPYYVVALIDLAEGPRMMSNIVGEARLRSKSATAPTRFEDREDSSFRAREGPPVNFDESDEQKLVRETTASFVKRHCKPADVRQWDRTGQLPEQVYAAMAEAGLLAMMVPAEYGGVGSPIAHCAIGASEEIAGPSVDLKTPRVDRLGSD